MQMLQTLCYQNPREIVPLEQAEVLRLPGIQTTLVRELLVHLARLRRANPEYKILLRGQSQDHRNCTTNCTVITPTAFRTGGIDAESRTLRLRKACALLCEETSTSGLSEESRSDLRDPFVSQIVLQHYHAEAKVDTPWIDLTESPQIALYFINQSSPSPVIYAFAIPRSVIRHSISLNQKMPGPVCFELGSYCPADALRPHFQAAYSLAIIEDTEKAKAHDIAGFASDVGGLLLCKFELNISSVLGEVFHSFGRPQGPGVYPRESDDPMKRLCQTLGRKVNPLQE